MICTSSRDPLNQLQMVREKGRLDRYTMAQSFSSSTLLSTLSSCINCCWKYNVCWSTGTSNSWRMTVFKSATVSSYRKAIVYMHVYTNTACMHGELTFPSHRDDSQSLNVPRNTKPPRRHETTCCYSSLTTPFVIKI